MSHHTLLFVSDLANDAPVDAVIDVARVSRANNQRTDITGLLLFDGTHFAQLMEGPKDAVVRVAEWMHSDPRHRNMEVLHSALEPSARRFPSWRLGFLLLDFQEFGIGSLHGQRGTAALDSFLFLLPALDIAVGEALPAQLRAR